MTLTYRATSAAAPEAVWALLSRPDRWRLWAPHLRGAIGMGRPEVRAGTIGVALVGGVVPLPGAVLEKRSGRAWTWQVGLVRVLHRVRPRREGGSEVEICFSAPWPVEPILALTYGPVVRRLLLRLARLAEGEGDPPTG